MIETVAADLVTMGRCFGFCGIAHPQAFLTLLERHGLDLAGFYPLEDHQRYSSVVIEKILARARQAGAEFLVTTEKDLVKLAHVADDLPLPLLGLRMQVIADKHFAESVLLEVQSWKKQS
jgi:tetraacyldisaccharide 4'-kinase